jgi:DNA-binding transcriptional regulator YiaG
MQESYVISEKAFDTLRRCSYDTSCDCSHALCNDLIFIYRVKERFALKARPNVPRLIQALKRLRKQIGLSQQELAVRLGVSLPTVSRWENRQSKPSPLAFEKIEAFLHEVGEEGEVLIEKYIRKQMRSME